MLAAEEEEDPRFPSHSEAIHHLPLSFPGRGTVDTSVSRAPFLRPRMIVPQIKLRLYLSGSEPFVRLSPIPPNGFCSSNCLWQRLTPIPCQDTISVIEKHEHSRAVSPPRQFAMSDTNRHASGFDPISSEDLC
ncbi:hypothetical protein CEXT_522591 [Caerostris extrusa]|uniref:Uncharacterized protein n=1 Tax=Caerostris extrusa TaxID=172846 RepID=A0AAV4MQ64_CAEEX|nr:hypothetical protein CEXT_522591 [Caerostris extrusa]